MKNKIIIMAYLFCYCISFPASRHVKKTVTRFKNHNNVENNLDRQGQNKYMQVETLPGFAKMKLLDPNALNQATTNKNVGNKLQDSIQPINSMPSINVNNNHHITSNVPPIQASSQGVELLRNQMNNIYNQQKQNQFPVGSAYSNFINNNAHKKDILLMNSNQQVNQNQLQQNNMNNNGLPIQQNYVQNNQNNQFPVNQLNQIHSHDYLYKVKSAIPLNQAKNMSITNIDQINGGIKKPDVIGMVQQQINQIQGRMHQPNFVGQQQQEIPQQNVYEYGYSVDNSYGEAPVQNFTQKF